jgi:hypothetical protein
LRQAAGLGKLGLSESAQVTRVLEAFGKFLHICD